MKAPHRNTWELKPEYRHYEKEEDADNPEDKEGEKKKAEEDSSDDDMM